MTDMLVWVLVILPPVDWVAALILGNLALRYPHVLTLRERAMASAVVAVVATIAGILAWSRLGIVAVSDDTAILLAAVALSVASLPSVIWLALLAAGRFRIPKDQK